MYTRCTLDVHWKYHPHLPTRPPADAPTCRLAHLPPPPLPPAAAPTCRRAHRMSTCFVDLYRRADTNPRGMHAASFFAFAAGLCCLARSRTHPTPEGKRPSAEPVHGPSPQRRVTPAV